MTKKAIQKIDSIGMGEYLKRLKKERNRCASNGFEDERNGIALQIKGCLDTLEKLGYLTPTEKRCAYIYYTLR